ncbi:hypothetical protein GPECTOR_80g164 [Gonium pectorale]|uniref:Uncharacterized protein n=1 Tax=Gonium pectorale TaxID=33097 RepID=A0A150G1V9_GONPE|nr:hypothetical protein GPECTOR_80g164 [Gonium pectorale]|eukprot:KXZ43804.1 hypothetical protein GPECTOR_80g164 [Gonium pectorale]
MELVAADGESDEAALAFQSEVLVDSRPLQLRSVITRTALHRPDGRVDVRYSFQDTVVTSARQSAPGSPGAGPARSGSPIGEAGRIGYGASSAWLHSQE